MGLLEAARLAVIICTRDCAPAVAFYRETPGVQIKLYEKFKQNAVGILTVPGTELRQDTDGNLLSVTDT
jgi:hypothetical protein